MHKILGGLFLISTFLSTIAFGYHYTEVWIAALPLVILSRGIGARSLPWGNPARRHAIFAGVGLPFFWVVIVWDMPQSLVHSHIIQIVAVMSLVIPLWLEQRLALAEGNVIHAVDGGFTADLIAFTKTPMRNKSA